MRGQGRERVGDRAWPEVPTRASLTNHTLEIFEQREVKQWNLTATCKPNVCDKYKIQWFISHSSHSF